VFDGHQLLWALVVFNFNWKVQTGLNSDRSTSYQSALFVLAAGKETYDAILDDI